VRLVKERGVSVAQAARDLDVHENVLRKWMRDAAADPQQAFPGQGVMKPEHAELDRLRKENARLKMERDLLKKAAAYFARSRCEIRLHGETPRELAGVDDVRDARCLQERLLRLVEQATQQEKTSGRSARQPSASKLRQQRPDVWCTTRLA
jgi:transposase